MIHCWLDSVLVYTNTTGCGMFSWGWDVRTLQQFEHRHQLHSTSGSRVALQLESRAIARSAWTLSLTARGCFNHWGAHRARGSGLKCSCALEESPVVYSNEHRTANWNRVGHSTTVLAWAMQYTAAPYLKLHGVTVQWKKMVRWQHRPQDHSQ